MKRSEWRCARCHESTSVDEATCVHCDWPREEAEQSSRRRLNPLWSCSKCGREEQDECTECTRCSTPRWNGCEQFDGTRFFVNRTPMDRELDCSSMPLLHWLQLLRPPSLSESLSALFVSGMVDDRAEAQEFAVQFFPPKVDAWMVAQDCSDNSKLEETTYKTLAASEAKWRALFFKPKTGLMHIKLYMFRFTKTLRLMVCSANPTCMSWSFQRENMWVQDFPLCMDAKGVLMAAPASEFGAYLRAVLAHMRMTDACLSAFGLLPSCVAVDFNGARAQLVASIPGEWSLLNGVEREHFGFLRLRALIRRAGWSSLNNRKSQIAIQSGSIGSDFSHEHFFDDFMLSLGGADAAESYQSQQHDSSAGSDDEEDDMMNPLLGANEGRYPANLSIFFPSRTIGQFNEILYKRYTKRDPDIHCTVSSWHSLSYPTGCFHEMLPPGAAAMVAKQGDGFTPPPAPHCHSKFVFRMVDDANGAERAGQVVAYIYIGSHNFSKTAWGYRFGKNKEFLKCNSLELGVLLSTKSAAEAQAWCAALPFDLAASKYNTEDMPYSTHTQHIAGRYYRTDNIAKCKGLLADFVQLGFHDEGEVMEALMKANGDSRVALKILIVQRGLE